LVPEAEERRRSWRGPTLALSLAAHAGLAAMLWVDQPPQPEAGAVVSIEIVSTAGAASASAANSGASPVRAPAEAATPERAPAPKAMTAPDAPRAAREPPHEARPQQAQRPQREAPAMPAPERATARPNDATALRRPAPPEAAPAALAAAAPSAAEAPKSMPPATVAPPSAEVALRRPARIPPPPVKAPRLAAPPPTAKRGGESARAPSQTASVPIVAADAAPGAAAPGAGPENGITPPRYGFGSAANPIPRYPEIARENGWEGVVMLSVSVGAGGEALSVSILKSSGHSLLDASAVDAVRRWRFEPARRAGVPISGSATVPIRFRLED
jgi:protein TonB